MKLASGRYDVVYQTLKAEPPIQFSKIQIMSGERATLQRDCESHYPSKSSSYRNLTLTGR